MNFWGSIAVLKYSSRAAPLVRRRRKLAWRALPQKFPLSHYGWVENLWAGDAWQFSEQFRRQLILSDPIFHLRSAVAIHKTKLVTICGVQRAKNSVGHLRSEHEQRGLIRSG